jgi:hypothetical protein
MRSMKSLIFAIILIIITYLFLINSVYAETSFYDNPDDALIYSYSFYSPNFVDNSQGGGGCLTDWNCSSWSACINNLQSRNCIKIRNSCNAGAKPGETQNCTISSPDFWTGNKTEEKAEENKTIPETNQTQINSTIQTNIFSITGGAILNFAKTETGLTAIVAFAGAVLFMILSFTLRKKKLAKNRKNLK